MSKITRAVFRPGSTTTQISGLSMYDYGQELEIHGLSLPREVSVEYSLNGAEPTIDRIGYTIDGVTTAAIPDGILSDQGNLKIYIRVLSPDSGQTEYTITGKVNYREKPSVQPDPGEVNPFGNLKSVQLKSGICNACLIDSSVFCSSSLKEDSHEYSLFALCEYP